MLDREANFQVGSCVEDLDKNVGISIVSAFIDLITLSLGNYRSFSVSFCFLSRDIR